ncbi:hypothetical protein ABT299_35895 [Spirillospora sp. NPDC000708]
MGDAGAIAAGVARALRDGRFAEVEALFAAPLRAVAPTGAVGAAWAAEIARHGAVTSVGDPAAEPLGTDLTRVSVPVACERGALTVVMSVDGAGLLNGLRLAPGGAEAWSPPPYADPSAFEEREVTVGSGPLAVPGTLTLPRGTGPHPGTVLLAGGGPFDRDATSGPNKPLKDLAWGLATSGVAVLRFDKATCAHPAEVAADPAFTMADEYVPHAVAAVRLLRDDPAVDAERVFVLGHSMGGKAAPRVATAEPSVAGLVIMAGDAQPMHEAAVRVTRYLASLDPGPDADAAVAAITRQAARVADPALSPADPAADLPFGLSAPYWLDMRSYDPVATALAVGKPMLILQGGRDYQVTVEDDLSRWRAALEGRPGVTVRVHAADDHLFFPGTGPSTPAGYDRPQHVDPAVLDDIAAWLNA